MKYEVLHEAPKDKMKRKLIHLLGVMYVCLYFLTY